MLKLIVGVSRKIGLPGYSSVGASCQIEVELTAGLLDDDPHGFRDQVRRAYAAARQAVDDDLACFEAAAGTTPSRRITEVSSFTEASKSLSGTTRQTREATARQLQTLAALAKDRQIGIDKLARSLGADHTEDLSVAQASALISRLRATPANRGSLNHAH